MAAIETQSGNSDLLIQKRKLYDCVFSNDGANCDDSYSAGNTDFKFYNSSSSEKPTDFLVQLMHKILIQIVSKSLKVYILNIQTMMMVLLYYIRLEFGSFCTNGYKWGGYLFAWFRCYWWYSCVKQRVTCSLVKVTIGTSAVDASCIISSNVVTIDDSSSSAGYFISKTSLRQLLM